MKLHKDDEECVAKSKRVTEKAAWQPLKESRAKHSQTLQMLEMDGPEPQSQKESAEVTVAQRSTKKIASVVSEERIVLEYAQELTPAG